MVLAGVAAATWLGFFSYRHVEYSNQLWWQFAWNGNAPRFLRATVAVCAVLVWAAVAFLIHRAAGGALPARPGDRRRAPPRWRRAADPAERRPARRQEVPGRGGRERVPDVRRARAAAGFPWATRSAAGRQRSSSSGGCASSPTATAAAPSTTRSRKPICRPSSTWAFRSSRSARSRGSISPPSRWRARSARISAMPTGGRPRRASSSR